MSVSLRTSVFNGAAANTTVSASLIPVPGDFLIAFTLETGAGPLGSTTALTDDNTDIDNNAQKWTRLTTASFNSGSAQLSLWVRNAFINNTTTTIITQTPTGSPTTGLELVVLAFSGMGVAGTAALRQYTATPNGTPGTPSSTFSAATLTTNLIYAIVGNLTNPPNLSQPTSFSLQLNIGQTTPLGLQSGMRTSGHTSTAITWGSASGTDWGTLAFELNADVVAPFIGTNVLLGKFASVAAPPLVLKTGQSLFSLDGYNDGYATRGLLSRSRNVIEVKQSTLQIASVFMQTPAGAGLPGLASSLTIAIKKAGGNFAVISPTVTDQGSGWYDFTLSATDTNTLGLLQVSVIGPGVNPNNDLQYNIVAALHSDVASSASSVSTSVSTINVTINGVASNLSTVSSASSSTYSNSAALNTALAGTSSAATSTQSNATALASSAGAAETTATALPAAVASVGTQVAAVAVDVTALSNAVSSASLVINNIVNDVTGVSNAAANVPSDLLNALLADHALAGSFGEGIAIAVGLLQGNFFMDNITNTPNGQTAARLRLFRTAVATAAATPGGTGEGEFASFDVTTTYTGPGRIATHRVVKL